MTREDNNDERLTPKQRELLEEIANWDEEEYPLAKHARQILKKYEERDSE